MVGVEKKRRIIITRVSGGECCARGADQEKGGTAIPESGQRDDKKCY